MQYTVPADPPPIKIGGQRYIAHPRPETIGVQPLFGNLDALYKSDDREATTRDQVGIAPCVDGGPFLYHLPTSLTFKIENELTSITSLQFANHGAFLAVGTSSGLIRLYCFGRSHEHNVVLQSLQLNYENYLSQPQGTEPVIRIDEHALTRFDQNTSWLSLIGKGINIASFGSSSTSRQQTSTPMASLMGGVAALPNNSKSGGQGQGTNNVEYQVHELVGHDNAVTGIQFSTCLNFLITSDLNGKIIMWALTNEYYQAFQYHKEKNQLGGKGATATRKAQQTVALALALESATSSTTTKSTSTTQLEPFESLLMSSSRGTLNDAINKPIQLQSWDSVPSTSNNITLSPRGGYFAINHNSIGISIYRTDLRDPVRILYSIPSTQFNPTTLTPGHLATWSPNGHYLAVPWEQGRVAIYAPLYPEIQEQGNSSMSDSNTTNNNNNNNTQNHPNQSISNINYPHRLLSPTPGRITALAFSPCGRYLFTADTTLTMVLWDINSEQPVWILDPLLLMYNTRDLITSQSAVPFEPNQADLIAGEDKMLGSGSTGVNYDPTQITHPQLFSPYGHLSPGDTLYHGSITQQQLPPYYDANRLDHRFTSAPQQQRGAKNPTMINNRHPNRNTNPIYLPPPPPIKINGSWPLTPNGTIHTDLITSCCFTFNTLASNRIFNQSTYPTANVPSRDGIPPYLPRAQMKINPGQIHEGIVQVAPPDLGGDKIDYQLPYGPKPQYFPYVLSTTSLDGTTKLWNITPNYPTTVSSATIESTSAVYGPNLADLSVNLLQTIYTKNHLVQKAAFTSRNLLLIAVTEDENADGIKTINQVKHGGKFGEDL